MKTPEKYRKKPVVIEAMQWDTGTDASVVIDWILSRGGTARYACDNPDECDRDRTAGVHYIRIHTLEGTIDASRGDWIIRGVKGEFYPCKPDIFTVTYEPATKPSALAASAERGEPWPFRPGDVVSDVEGAEEEWLETAPEGVVVTDQYGIPWQRFSKGWAAPHTTGDGSGGPSSYLVGRSPLTVASIPDVR